jgi:mRNA interferase HigB
VHVVSRRALVDFWSIRPNAEAPLKAWYKAASTGTYKNFAELKQTFKGVDYVSVEKKNKSTNQKEKKEFYVFDIGGNKYRLVAAIHFNRQRLFIRFVMTHEEYDRGDWKR